MKYPILIFDIDDTLIRFKEPSDYFYNLINEVLSYFKFENTPKTKEEINRFYGSGKSYPKILRDWGVKDIKKFWQVFDELDFNYRSKMAKEGKFELCPHAFDVILRLYQQGYILCALSNSNSKITNFFMDYFKIAPYFKGIKGLPPGKPPNQVKPEIEGLKLLLKSIGVDQIPKDAILIGDSETDLKTAKNANIKFFLYDPNNKFKSKINYFQNELGIVVFNDLIELLWLIPHRNAFGNSFSAE
ncbi:MAG: HAD family hydrolase [Promethearchaeota archaeon]